MNPYARNKTPYGGVSRVVVELDQDLVNEVDAWGVPAGKRSRADAIRSLLRTGLDAQNQTGKAPEETAETQK